MTPTATDNETAPADRSGAGLVGEAPPSPAGPIDAAELGGLATAPNIEQSRLLQSLRFNQRQIEFVFRARRELGDVFRMRGTIPGDPVDHQPPRPRALALHRQARAARRR